MKTLYHVLAVALLHLSCTSIPASPVSPREQAQWLRRVIPLPKRISITEKLELPATGVKLRVRAGAGEVEKTAAEELRSLFKSKASADPAGGTFEILLGVCSSAGRLEGIPVPQADRLAALPNAEQAYTIQPIGPGRLVLTALDERGVYYAAQTLVQLLQGAFKNGYVSMLLASVLDWPDLAERGEWGGSANKDIAWMSHLKMNLVESHVILGTDKDGHGTVKVPRETIDLARSHALNFVPVITHLNGLRRTGIYAHFPQLQGKGKSARNKAYESLVAPCCSEPKFAEVLADWMGALASQPGVTDVCAWLTELNQFCSDEGCTKVGQWAFEARRLVEAWRMARKKHPDLHLRILLTQGSYKTNDKVLAEIPPEVGVTYYDGSRTYDSSRDPMIYPLLEAYAAKGRWLGCYPQLTASWRIVCPWSGPQFIRARMNEFVRKKLQCLCGYATPHNRLYEFNVTAAAEWAWNAGGRTEREFSLAYWTRKGSKDPEAAADWAVMLGPVGWDVYGSRIPAHNFFGRAAGLVAGRGKPKLGEKGLFRYFPSKKHIEKDLAICKKAMAIARRLDEPVMVLETEVIQGYVQMIKSIYDILVRVSKSKRPDYAKRIELQKATANLSVAGLSVSEALQKWEMVCGQGKHIAGSRLMDTVDVTEKTVVDIGESLVPLGLRNPVRPYLRNVIGKWVSSDFDGGPEVTKRFEITDTVSLPGKYQVGFKYTSGWNGLVIHRVALAAGPEDKTASLKELKSDKHRGVAAHRNRANVYSIEIPELDPSLRYFIVASIRGVNQAAAKPGKKGCNGEVWMMTRRPENWREIIASAKPLTDEEMARKRAARFTGKGLRVGILKGGYGASGILKSLLKVKGIDAQPIGGLYAGTLQQCQVIVLAQPKGASMGAEAVKALEAFVRAGGGLLTTHDAVGYRGLPPLIKKVCKGGARHVRETQWRVAAAHPVTAGLARDQALPHAYYDHIELNLGPKGVVLARAEKSGKPVLVCGEYGKGRYVACGLAIGLNARTEDEPPCGPEKKLLENAVHWCGRGP